MTSMNKLELRRYLRALHEGPQERARQSLLLCAHVISSPEYKNARILGAYMPMAHEADVTPVILDALRHGKQVALPRCWKAPHMDFHLIQTMDDLVVGTYGILEPAASAPILPASCLDLLLVPLEGIDNEGFRLGKGGGYYDCLLAGSKLRTMGCAMSWQQVSRLPRDQWDQPLQACADQFRIKHF